MGTCSSSSSVHPPSTETIPIQNQIDPTTNTGLESNQSRNQIDAYLEHAQQEFNVKYAQQLIQNAKLEDFELQRTIGTGSFARVMLVKHGNQSLALKVMEKHSIVELYQVNHILSEKRILQSINCPFIVNLVYAFKDNSYLYLALEFISGGEMFSHLRNMVKYPEDQACFYAAQVVLALEYLHHLSGSTMMAVSSTNFFRSIVDIIYRNVKPEDILFGEDGYLKLTDFRFAKVVQDRTYSLCGTPEYLAPEIVSGMGQNKDVDYWALGVLIYEMTAGFSPFNAEKPMQIYVKILKGSIQFPAHFCSNLINLLPKLLQIRPAERYGNLENGMKDIKNHQWFSSINWIDIFEKRVKAPYIPKVGEDHYEKYDEQPLTTAEAELYSTEFDSFYRLELTTFSLYR
ncbi:unnamed protein product, partial [Didymodactylos carnosus]